MVVSCRGETQCVGNVHNGSSKRVAEFDSEVLTENLDSAPYDGLYGEALPERSTFFRL